MQNYVQDVAKKKVCIIKEYKMLLLLAFGFVELFDYSIKTD